MSRLHGVNRRVGLTWLFSVVAIHSVFAGSDALVHCGSCRSEVYQFTLHDVTYESAYPPPIPDRIKLDITVWYREVCESQCDDPPCADPKVRVGIFDCDGAQIGSWQLRGPWSVHCVGGSDRHDYTFDFPCDRFPKTYEVQGYWDRWWGVGCDEFHAGPDWELVGVGGTLPAPDFLPACALTLEDLACLLPPEPEEIGGDNFHFYKSTRTIYTRCEDDTEVNWGEAVNGQFIAPEEGQLFVRVEGSGSAVNLWGSLAADDPGWMVFDIQGDKPVRQGTPVDLERCLEMEAGERFFFNVRAGKQNAPCTFKATFDWIPAAWDTENCGLEHYQKVLDLKVEPLRVLPEPADPVMPQRRNWTLNDGTNDYTNIELRIPMCPLVCKGSGHEAPTHPIGNLSDWFIAWPSADGKVISDGHAKGWTIDGNKLIAPGPDGWVYEFTGAD